MLILAGNNVNVTAAGSKILLNKTKITLSIGEKYGLKVKQLPKKAKVKWESSNKAKVTWNITHYEGNQFIYCESIDRSGKLTFCVGHFNDSTNKFVVDKTFTGKAKDFEVIQGITYRNGCLYQATFDNAKGNRNKISEFQIGGNVKNKTYSSEHYGTFDDTSLSKFELESLDFDSTGKLYIFMNIDGHGDPLYVSKNTY